MKIERTGTHSSVFSVYSRLRLHNSILNLAQLDARAHEAMHCLFLKFWNTPFHLKKLYFFFIIGTPHFLFFAGGKR